MLTLARSAREFLGEELARRIKTNPRYSLRAFARSLGLSPGELSEILREKRRISAKAALRISSSLGLSEEETRHFLFLAQASDDSVERAEVPSQRQLTLDVFEILSDWQCFAILNLADCADFQPGSAWIARRLGISRAEVDVALDRLERVGMIDRTTRGWKVSEDFVLSPEGIPSEAIRKYHKQILEKAAQSIELQPPPEREFSGTGFALDPKHLPRIREDLRKFRDELLSRYGTGRKTEVYHLEIALFRLTEKGESK